MTLRRVPGLPALFLTALLARLCYGTVPLSLILTVRHTTGSYRMVGVVLALYALTAAALAPVRAGLVERYGVRLVLPLLAGPFCGGLAVFACSGPDRLALVAALTGACAPPLGPVVRARLSELLGTGPLLERAFSVDAVAEELLYVGGPLLVGLVGGPTGMLVSGALMAVGVTGLALLTPGRGRGAEAGRPGGIPGWVPGIGRAGVMAGAAGLTLGALSLLLVAASAGTGALPWLEAALAAGSVVGGLVHGAVRWRVGAATRLTWSGAGLGIGVAALALAPGTAWLLAGVAVLGLFVSPALASAYLVADERAGAGRRAAAGAWMNTAFNTGSVAGTALAGVLPTQGLPAGAGFVLAALPLLAAAALRTGGSPALAVTPAAADHSR